MVKFSLDQIKQQSQFNSNENSSGIRSSKAPPSSEQKYDILDVIDKADFVFG